MRRRETGGRGACAGGGGAGGGRSIGRFSRARSTWPLHRRVDRSFLEYASYVIRDRAIPNLADGLKPVQRRILWSLHQNDDGKFIKVANIVGHCMQYHPHGDASIGDALVVLANKRYLIERQGNFGNLYTGDPAAAPRYIECRLTELARRNCSMTS
jgi:topoisomerase IV subunit A